MGSNLFNNSNIDAFIRTLRNKGFTTAVYRSIKTLKDSIQYPRWYRNISNREIKIQCEYSFEYSPLISIVVPTYNTPIDLLCEMVDSVKSQTYDNWELCIADASDDNSEVRNILEKYRDSDNRIKLLFLQQNEGISGNTNRALALSSGSYIGLLDHDDILAPNALFEIIKVINEQQSIDVIYTDEDKVTDITSDHFYPNFKPDYNAMLLQSCNYICHFFVFKRSVLEKIGGFRTEYDGSQDYDFILRATGAANNVHHIAKILYHWRVHSGSVAGDPGQKQYCYDAAVRALSRHLTEKGISGNVSEAENIGFYNTEYMQTIGHMNVSIITNNRDFSLCDNGNSELMINISYIDDNLQLAKVLDGKNGHILLFIPEHIRNITCKDILKLCSYIGLPDVEAVSPRLVYGNRTICMGIEICDGTLVGCYNNVPIKDMGYYGRALIDQYVSLCSLGIFMCRYEVYYDYISKYAYELSDMTFNEMSLHFSGYISLKDKNIAVCADSAVKCLDKLNINNYNIFIEKHMNMFKQIKKYYVVPPWYH